MTPEAALDTASLDKALDDLRAGTSGWVALPLDEKVALLEALPHKVLDVAPWMVPGIITCRHARLRGPVALGPSALVAQGVRGRTGWSCPVASISVIPTTAAAHATRIRATKTHWRGVIMVMILGPMDSKRQAHQRTAHRHSCWGLRVGAGLAVVSYVAGWFRRGGKGCTA
jgi:hypothetical protein